MQFFLDVDGMIDHDERGSRRMSTRNHAEEETFVVVSDLGVYVCVVWYNQEQ